MVAPTARRREYGPMSVSGSSAVALGTPTLRLRDPDSGLRRVPVSLDSSQIWITATASPTKRTHGVELFAFVNEQLLDIDYGRPRLLVAEIRTGSLLLELVEEFAPYASAAGAGAALVALARMLRGGTKGLDEWQTFMARSRTHRIRALREEAEERALLLETRERLLRLEASAPDLEIEVLRSEDGA